MWKTFELKKKYLMMKGKVLNTQRVGQLRSKKTHLSPPILTLSAATSTPATSLTIHSLKTELRKTQAIAYAHRLLNRL